MSSRIPLSPASSRSISAPGSGGAGRGRCAPRDRRDAAPDRRAAPPAPRPLGRRAGDVFGQICLDIGHQIGRDIGRGRQPDRGRDDPAEQHRPEPALAHGDLFGPHDRRLLPAVGSGRPGRVVPGRPARGRGRSDRPEPPARAAATLRMLRRRHRSPLRAPSRHRSLSRGTDRQPLPRSRPSPSRLRGLRGRGAPGALAGARARRCGRPVHPRPARSRRSPARRVRPASSGAAASASVRGCRPASQAVPRRPARGLSAAGAPPSSSLRGDRPPRPTVQRPRRAGVVVRVGPACRGVLIRGVGPGHILRRALGRLVATRPGFASSRHGTTFSNLVQTELCATLLRPPDRSTRLARLAKSCNRPHIAAASGLSATRRSAPRPRARSAPRAR